jgi:hypothetical protein
MNGRNERHVHTTMAHNTSIAGGLDPSPFLLQKMATPHIPRRVDESIPVNVTFVVDIERSDPIHLVDTRNNN